MKNCKANISAQISWVYTDDLEASTIFYSEVLGFECLRDQGSARIFATVGNAAIGVCRALDERVVEPRGGMISIVTDDVDAWYRQLIELGVDINQAPHRLEQFGIYSFCITDPDGYLIEFQQFDSVS